MYRAKILADSLSPDGVRLTTMEVEYPHAIHKDLMTHRMFSRNFQSFRGFPPEKVIENIQDDPFIPESFDLRIAGMGQGEAHPDQQVAWDIWDRHIECRVATAKDMTALNLAKAQVNFVLQDLTWITGIISATEWDNFWKLRLALDPNTGDPLARPEVYNIALLMLTAYESSEPRQLEYGQWHVPLISADEPFPKFANDRVRWDFLKAVSTGRCARTSYVTHHGLRDPGADIGLHEKLKSDTHMSPFEHVARPFGLDEWFAIAEIQDHIDKYLAIPRKDRERMQRQLEFHANFRGWHQYRLDVE